MNISLLLHFNLMLVETWRVYQPDCPVVEASEKLQSTRLEAISSRVSGKYIQGHLAVETRVLRELINVLRNSPRILKAEILMKGVGTSIISLAMHRTNLMNSLSENPKLLWFSPIFAKGGYEYWIVVSLGSTRMIREALKANNHEIKVVNSRVLPGAYPRIASIIQACTNLTDVSRRASTPANDVINDILSGSTLGNVARKHGYSKSYLSRKRREALSTCKEALDALSLIFKFFDEPG
ncbi:MAG: hypothetical protein ACP5PL_06460 [Infirmifilum sp.]|jgi:hypothetical protein